MKPILSRRTRVSPSSLSADNISPSISISPSVGRSRPPIKFSSVDFPEPDGPMIDTISPRPMCRSSRSSAVTFRLPSNCLETPRNWITCSIFPQWPGEREFSLLLAKRFQNASLPNRSQAYMACTAASKSSNGETFMLSRQSTDQSLLPKRHPERRAAVRGQESLFLRYASTPKGDYALQIVATAARAASVMVREHCGFISALIAFRRTIPNQRVDRPHVAPKDRTPGESPASVELHIGARVRRVCRYSFVESVGRV